MKRDSVEKGEERLAAALLRMDTIVDWERRDRSAGMVRDLEPVRDVLARLGSPHRAFSSVHVGGSKGKGSVSALIGAALEVAGIRVGVYASPHVEHVTERVRVGGADVEEGVLAAALDRAWSARAAGLAEGTPAGAATWFDLMTAAAFVVFRDAGVSWAVVEVGLGGRLDSTNAVDGEVAVLTTVELEHTAVLGNTRAAIAREKAAILKAGRVLVTGVPADGEAAAVVLERAREVGGRVRFVDASTGTFAERNRAVAAAALDELGSSGVVGSSGGPLSGELLTPEVVARAVLPARVERFEVGGVPVVLDAGHVAVSVEGLLAELATDPALAGPVQGVLALGKDKQVEAVLKALRVKVDRLLCTSSSSGPLLGADELASRARALGFDAEAEPDPARALALALAAARQSKGWVLVLGSFYTAGVLRPLLRGD